METKQSWVSRLFSASALDSRIKSANTQASEMWLGYFAGPCFVYIVYYAVAGTYLTQFYTDVLGIGGIFLTMMPVLSKIFDAVTNIIMGRISAGFTLDTYTHTTQRMKREAADTIGNVIDQNM